MGDIAVRNQPCLDPSCGSSDARQIYGDGTSFCFSCQEFFSKEEGDGVAIVEERKQTSSPSPYKKLSVDDILELPIRGFADRAIKKKVNEYYGVRVSYDSNGAIEKHYYPYGNNSWKVRTLPKVFSWFNKTNALFGQDKFNGAGKRLIICEGEIDTLSVALAYYDKYDKIYPVVGMSSSSMTKSLLENRDWIRSFQEVVLCLDEDAAGEKAVNEAVKIIGIDKVKLTKLPYNDANDVLTKDGVPVSVKTLIENGVVKGSWNNLVESLNKSPTKEIYFDIFTKKYSGDGKDKKVIGLDAYRFVINEDNIEKLSGGVVEKVGNQFVFAESLNEDIPFAWGPKLTRMKEVVDELRTNGWKLEPNIKWYFANTRLAGQGRKTLEQRYKIIFDAGQQYLEDDNEKQNFQKVINQAYEQHKEEIMMGKEVTLGGGGEGKTQFSLSAPAWKALVKQQGGKVAHIEISNERVDQLVKKSLTILGSSIVDLFSDLEKFSELVNSYLSTNDPNRSEVGSKAIEYAEKIKPSTEKVVGNKK